MFQANMDRFITIETPTEGSFGDNDVAGAGSWATFKQVWAEKRDIIGKERFTSSQSLPTEITVFRMRWIDNVTYKMRIVLDGKTYNIIGIAELGRREGLDITGEAIVT